MGWGIGHIPLKLTWGDQQFVPFSGGTTSSFSRSMNRVLPIESGFAAQLSG